LNGFLQLTERNTGEELARWKVIERSREGKVWVGFFHLWTTDVHGRRVPLGANIDETESAAIITEQGGQENHRERSQDGSSFCSQFA
jgi:hypothetical protein